MPVPTPNEVAAHLQGALDLVALKTGNRGVLAGYAEADVIENSGSTTSITISSPDCLHIDTSGSVTLSFTPPTGVAMATKVISLSAISTTVLTVNGAWWASGSAPSWGTTGMDLVIVAFMSASGNFLSVFYNSEA